MAREVFAVNHTLTGGRSFGDRDVIIYRVQYPEFVSYAQLASLDRLNTYYRDSAQALARDFLDTYDSYALADFYEHQRQSLPFQSYELNRSYTLTYGQDCALSLYLDESRYTGGAHGITLRGSDTWNALSGQRIALSTLFPQGFDYAQLLQGLIVEEIEDRNAAEPNLYFDDPEAMVAEAFSEESFYLTPSDLVIYFQPYDIAPFSTGIPTFAFPYGLVGAAAPNCG